MFFPKQIKEYQLKTMLIGLCSTLLMNCGTPQQSPLSDQPDLNGNIMLRLAGEPNTLNPILSNDAYSSQVESFIFNSLFRVNEKLELEPDLLDSYTVSKDGLRYTFHLKKNIHWHDGTPFSAEDVKFTFDSILDPKTNTVRRSNFVIDNTPIEFTVIDTHTLQAKLPKPFAPFLVNASMEIIPKHIYENKDINTHDANRMPIGTGPFKFKTWSSGQYILLERHDAYFDKTAKLKTVTFKVIPDTNTALVALKKGELDMTSIEPKEVENIRKKSFLTVHQMAQLQYSYLGFNLKNPLFADATVRKAITLAINKDALIQSVLKGYGQVATLPQSPVSWAYPKDHKWTKPTYDPGEAKALLKEAGWTLNPKTNTLEKNGTPFEFTLILGKGSKIGEKSAQIIQQYLAQVGIKMNIQLREWQSFVKILSEPKDPKAFDAAMLSWALGIDPDAYNIWHSSQYPKGFNFINYQNKSVDEKLETARTTINQSERAKLYKDAYTQIAEDYPYIFLYYPESIIAVNNRVSGLATPGPAGLILRPEDVFIRKQNDDQ